MYGNPYYGSKFQYGNYGQQTPMTNPTMTTQPQYLPPIQNQNTLNGKYVDSFDVVRASETLLDGSITYYPFTDGSAIVTKQLQTDGTSKTIIYKPVEEEKKDMPKNITIEDVKKEIDNIDFSEIEEIKDELREMKKQLKDLKKKGD